MDQERFRGGDHRDRRYVITGGTSGIGRYCAEYLTAEGAQVWITGTRQPTLAEALQNGVAAGGSLCDVAQPEQVAEAMDEAYQRLGGLDGVFINAGIDGQAKTADQLDPETVSHLFRVNVLGVLTVAQAAHRLLDRPGAIVINSSVNALRPEPGFADYNASKAAALSLAQSLALDWGTEELCVTAVAPGYIPSRMTADYLNDPETSSSLLATIPVKRFGTSEEISRLVGFLLSNSVPYLNGAVIPVAGGKNI